MKQRRKQQEKKEPSKVAVWTGPTVLFTPKFEGRVGQKMAIATVAEYASFLFGFGSTEEAAIAHTLGDGAMWAAPKMKTLLTKGIEMCDAKNSAVRGWLWVIAQLSPDGDLRNAAKRKLESDD